MNETVFVVPVKVTSVQLQSFIDILNGWEFKKHETRLTFDEVMANPKLLEYICTEAVLDGVAMYDPLTFWNNDGWCDIRDYR